MCVFLCLTCFNWPSIVWLHPCCCRWQNLFLLYSRMCRLIVHRSWKSAGVPFDCFCLLTERQSGSSTQSERRRRFWTLREDKVRKETCDAERVRALGRLSALMVSRGVKDPCTDSDSELNVRLSRWIFPPFVISSINACTRIIKGRRQRVHKIHCKTGFYGLMQWSERKIDYVKGSGYLHGSWQLFWIKGGMRLWGRE